jgi:hypothetical protein
MALTTYATYYCDWKEGDLDVVSIHLTESGAQRRVIDYAISEIYHLSSVSTRLYSHLADAANNLINDHGCKWSHLKNSLVGLENGWVAHFYQEIMEILNGHTRVELAYQKHTLEA